MYKCEQVIYFNIFILIYILNGRAEGGIEVDQPRAGDNRIKDNQDQWRGCHQEILQGQTPRQGRIR